MGALTSNLLTFARRMIQIASKKGRGMTTVRLGFQLLPRRISMRVHNSCPRA